MWIVRKKDQKEIVEDVKSEFRDYAKKHLIDSFTYEIQRRIQKDVGKVLLEFLDMPEKEYVGGSGNRVDTLTKNVFNKFESQIQDMINVSVSKTITEIMGSEKFIDQIVERIKNKQLQ